MFKCSIKGCGNKGLARGWCSKHYNRWKKYGDPTKVVMGPDCPRVCKKCGSGGPFYEGYRTCVKCLAKRHMKWRKKNIERSRDIDAVAARVRYKRNRELVLRSYGGKCKCCGEKREVFLCIDHKAGGGNTHRRLIGNGRMCGSVNYYSWLIRAGFPKGFQVLCHNCNFAKSHGGCPHKRRTR